MMFMMPIPPTSSEMAAMPPRKMVSTLVMVLAVSRKSCWVRMVKSSAPMAVRWRLRRIWATSSAAWGTLWALMACTSSRSTRSRWRGGAGAPGRWSAGPDLVILVGEARAALGFQHAETRKGWPSMRTVSPTRPSVRPKSSRRHPGPADHRGLSQHVLFVDKFAFGDGSCAPGRNRA
jgi:hypothetical protein